MRATLAAAGLIATASAFMARVSGAVSDWSEYAGFKDAYNRLHLAWPTIEVDGASGRSFGKSRFKYYFSDGTLGGDYVVNSSANQRVKIQCFATVGLTGSSTTQQSGWSSDASGDVVQTPLCPTNQRYGGYGRTQLEEATWASHYDGSIAGYGNCATGISSLGTAQLVAQHTGASWDGTYFPSPEIFWAPLTNNTHDQARVGSTDLGVAFFAGVGSSAPVQMAFGDSYSVGGGGFRGNTLSYTFDTNPTDGVTIDHWTTAPPPPSCTDPICAAQFIRVEIQPGRELIVRFQS